MSGSYCKYCGHRCFVYRTLPDGSWAGHMATCPQGMAHDREVTGYDHETAINSEEIHQSEGDAIAESYWSEFL